MKNTDNKLIHIFMGNVLCDCGQKLEEHFQDGCDPETYGYDKSWDVLMPVVEKIRTVLNETQNSYWHISKLDNTPIWTPIEEVLKIVLWCINFINSQTPKA